MRRIIAECAVYIKPRNGEISQTAILATRFAADGQQIVNKTLESGDAICLRLGSKT